MLKFRFMKSVKQLVATVIVCSTSTAAFSQDFPPLVAAVSFDRALPIRELERSPDLRAEAQTGRILLCGGGTLPNQIREVFHQEGKGELGSLVLIPTASQLSDRGDFNYWIDYWSAFRWKSIEVVHSPDRESALNDSKAVAALRNASAVWISGGDQSRLAQRYSDTPIEKGILSVIGRGGIVGGTSAGAAIASSVMIAGGFTEPQLSNGFPMVRRAIIDQHFTQKNRFQRLATAVQANPGYTGLGIDESTGLLLSDKKARVVGSGSVFVYKLQKDRPTEQLVSTNSNPPKTGDVHSVRVFSGYEFDADDLDVFDR